MNGALASFALSWGCIIATLACGGIGLWAGFGQWSAPWAAAALAAPVCLAAWLGLRHGENARAAARLAGCLRALAGGDYRAQCLARDIGGDPALARAAQDAVTRLKADLGFARGVLWGMATPCVVVDAEEILRFTNKNLLVILQQDGSPEDHYGQNVAHFFYGDASRPTVLGEAMRQKREITREVELTGRKGGKRKIRIDASPLYDLEGRLMGSLCVYSDLTDLRDQESALLAVNESLAKTSREAQSIGDQVLEETGRLADLVAASHSGAEEQSRRMGETVSAMEEMNAAVAEMAAKAGQAAQVSGQAQDKAHEGAQAVDRVVTGIGRVRSQALELKQDMGHLGEQAQAIGQILTVISDIADQTNLLALNAAIEAARAGEAGRGFAVVADEVRKLAEKTMVATKEVGDAIVGVQQSAAKNRDNVDLAAKTIEDTTELAHTSGQSLEEIVGLVGQATDQVRAIAAASERQSLASAEINRSVDQVAAISADTAQAMTDAARAVSTLAGQTRVLQDLIRAMRAQDA